ncbi:MAG TPA: N-acetylmuramoyl-L-alanine amidase-like domain-containing protein [Oligoflexus sp.]|uniref:N-acetylmuramoyl-L-alanine amidase-like domain-containing protein n=1 Tax=Oligoflexus sp. TaxID=1971216 RepID=UPI002D3EF1A1|nr:N-acetylmuramoyl-L-alanine amidase-like domain-containing protein [Oligoflexus sp.]HYX34042.1 N-acetylmuramoyl-L-alanine amidase-like domain-containing protein [Oligoflexus sp.]
MPLIKETLLTLLLSSAPALPLGQNLETISAFFLDKKFKTDALGEGPGQHDSDPLYRLDAFDCTTFVETVWAMHRTTPGQDWTQTLQDIRYRNGQVHFTERLHFISLDWMPYQQSKGRVRDVTADMGVPLQESKTLITRKGWYQKKHQAQLTDFTSRYPKDEPQRVQLKYLKFGELLDHPAGLEKLKVELKKGPLLANFVRPNFDTVASIGTHIDISHQGFLLLKDGSIILRHASLSLLKVGDEDFLDYMKFYRHHPTLKGMQLIRLL